MNLVLKHKKKHTHTPHLRWHAVDYYSCSGLFCALQYGRVYPSVLYSYCKQQCETLLLFFWYSKRSITMLYFFMFIEIFFHSCKWKLLEGRKVSDEVIPFD